LNQFKKQKSNMEHLNKQGLNPDTDVNPEKKISRKEAMEKAGKYAAFTAAAALMLLSPKTSQAASDEAPRGRGARFDPGT
jgi:hypothetical protein